MSVKSDLKNLVSSLCTILVAIWLSGNIDGHISEVTLCQDRLVLRCMSVRGYAISAFNQAIQANSAWSSVCG